MLATGGNAIISKYLGEGKHREARECLTTFVVVGVAVSIVVLAFTHLFLTPVCYFLGSNEVLLAGCEKYLATAISFAPACMLQSLFQSYLVTAEKPHLWSFPDHWRRNIKCLSGLFSDRSMQTWHDRSRAGNRNRANSTCPGGTSFLFCPIKKGSVWCGFISTQRSFLWPVIMVLPKDGDPAGQRRYVTHFYSILS